ncbi:DNA primase large subunit [Methanocalculus alkaliphilus]|uniref:DNA primase large subunit PriL n=1 Tax=Methanocalculus alkaliphilus TaxID=768730 RepID=UPI0020A1370E|nr:DNA primase large subunit PriL [Methanocalculus alkaliphilus]MCP1714556.1 DNA primase large subunit [Methanocalculus alkaliphilus]
MKLQIGLQELAHYPFLKEAQRIIADRGISLLTITQNRESRLFLEAAVQRIRDAAQTRDARGYNEAEEPFSAIVSYALARILISCIKNRNGIGLLSRFEAERALYFIQIEENQNLKNHLFRELGMPLPGGILPLTQYIELSSSLREERFRLVNRDLWKGMVRLSHEDEETLLRERIRRILLDQLPLDLPKNVCTDLSVYVTEVEGIISERITIEYGAVDEAGFPPCIRALYDAAGEGRPLTHSGRFALTTFLHTIGMETTGIISLFSGGSGFDLEMTSYQVNHIISQGDEGYTTPSCATMRTHGICVGKNKNCEQVNHPLNYYRRRKKTTKK